MDQHVHGPKCGCAEYMFNEQADDLFAQIDLEAVRCLNEQQNSVQRIVKPESEKLVKTWYVESDIDAEVIVIIPFNENVKIRSINVVSHDLQHSANRMKAYINAVNVNFDILEQPATEEFILLPNLDGENGNAVKISKFENVQSLVLHIKSTANDPIRISHIGLKGLRTFHKKQLANTIYELNPLPREIDPEKKATESVF